MALKYFLEKGGHRRLWEVLHHWCQQIMVPWISREVGPPSTSKDHLLIGIDEARRRQESKLLGMLQPAQTRDSCKFQRMGGNIESAK